MNVTVAFGILLLGTGLGALLVWLQQRAIRRQFLQGLESELEQALFGAARRSRQPNVRIMSSTVRSSSPLLRQQKPLPGGDSHRRQPQRESVAPPE